MQLSATAQSIFEQASAEPLRMGAIKKLAAAVKKDHALGMELWSTGALGPQLVAVLIMDKMLLTQEVIEDLVSDMSKHSDDSRNRLSEWLMANQLMKSKKTIALIESWRDHASPTLRRLYWYYQGRLRWMGKVPQDNASELLAYLDERMGSETPEVQWAMNFTAGWIGVHEPKYRSECVALGTRLGLYKDDHVSRGCTPNYLPEFIEVEAAKLGSQSLALP